MIVAALNHQQDTVVVSLKKSLAVSITVAVCITQVFISSHSRTYEPCLAFCAPTPLLKTSWSQSYIAREEEGKGAGHHN